MKYERLPCGYCGHLVIKGAMIGNRFCCRRCQDRWVLQSRARTAPTVTQWWEMERYRKESEWGALRNKSEYPSPFFDMAARYIPRDYVSGRGLEHIKFYVDKVKGATNERSRV